MAHDVVGDPYPAGGAAAGPGLALLLPGVDLDAARRLVPQDEGGGFIVGGPQTDGLTVCTPSGAVVATFGNRVTPQSLASAFNRLHGTDRRRFSFVGVGVDSPTTVLIGTEYEKAKYRERRFHSILGQR